MSVQALPLRPYQALAKYEVQRAWGKGTRWPAVVLPTGAGKTVVFAHLAAEEHALHGTQALILVHTTELADQAVDKLHSVAPHLSVGVIKAERNEINADLLVGTVQTVRGRVEQLGHVGLIIIDECHHATAASYQTVLDGIPDANVVGFTATLARGDGAALGDVWQEVVYRRDIIDMIRGKHLLPVRGKRVRVPDLDFRDMKRTGGDYQAGDLGEALTASLAPELVAKAYAEHASDRAGVLFAPTVASAYLFAEALNGAGIVTETVHGALPAQERRQILRNLRAGTTQVVSNCMVLTEGFDEPRVSCAVICRPTTSAGLYTQMVGRVLRPYPGQAEALVLDVVGVSGRHRLATLVDLVGDPTLIRKAPEEESLADLLIDEDGFDIDEERDTGGRDLRYVDGEYEVVDVDLFARSHNAWLKTDGETWFLPCSGSTVRTKRQLYVFIAQVGPERYGVAVCDAIGHGKFAYRGIDLDAAMAWGEEVVREYGGEILTGRHARWRDDEPGERQRRMAASLGIRTELMTKGEIADAISQRKGTQVIDEIVKGWTR